MLRVYGSNILITLKCTNPNLIIEQASIIAQRKPIEEVEMDKQLDNLINLLNLAEKDELVITKLRNIIEGVQHSYALLPEELGTNELVCP